MLTTTCDSFTVCDNFYHSLGLPEHLIESDITPNRGDCLSLKGIAREIAAKINQPIKLPSSSHLVETSKNIFNIETKLCSSYSACIVKEFNLNESARLLSKLFAMGINSVNPVVDVVNYTMYETGQPFHAFDLDKIRLPLVVKEADESSSFIGIDGKEIQVIPGDLVITDQTDDIKCLAGIMGSLDSAVSDKTQSVFLESAHFNAQAIAKTLRRLRISTDSSFRFERGIDSKRTQDSLLRLSFLLENTLNAKISDLSCFALDTDTKEIKLTSDYVKKILGIEIPIEDQIKGLESLGFECSLLENNLIIKSPSYRNDVSLPIDIVEEIIRYHGYHLLNDHSENFIKIPDSQPSVLPGNDYLSSRLVSNGYAEVISYSFISEKMHNNFSDSEYIKVSNAMYEEISVMRTSHWPSLLNIALKNISKGQKSKRIFELSRVFNGLSPESQPVKISGLLSGNSLDQTWLKNKSHDVDFFTIKNDILKLLSHIPSHSLKWVLRTSTGYKKG